MLEAIGCVCAITAGWPASLTADSWESLSGVNRNARRAKREPGTEHNTSPFNLQPGESVKGRFQVLKPRFGCI